MSYSRISSSDVPARRTASLNQPERLLERARLLLAGYPDKVNVTMTLGVYDGGDSITIYVDSRASMEERCGAVDWFAKKLGAPSGAGAPVLNESGFATYEARAELGANRKIYVNAFTQISKAS